MKNPPILSIRQAKISFAKKLLFEDLDLNLFQRDRVCLIGKNGVGKTTLMNAIAGKFEFDQGERWVAPGLSIGYLHQDEKILENITVKEFISKGCDLDEEKTYLIDIICQNLLLDQNALTSNLSGGQKRRANLAKALVLQPDILLLDEPTNHLDLEIIQWLEEYLKNYRGALILISHDRTFLEKTSNKIFWIRAGQIKVNNNGYKDFDAWSNGIIDQETRELKNLEKKVELERGWLQTGVTARRKRNIGRLHYLKDLTQKLEATRRVLHQNKNKIKITGQKIEDDAPQVIVSFNNASKSYGEKKLIEKFTTKILRGQRIGIIGKNGQGKSTLLKLITGEIKPDEGTVKRAKDLDLAYFDQGRSDMKPDLTLKEALTNSGSDYITLANGKTRHVCGYLKDFLFDPSEADTKVGTLSGGQQNRLMLAKTLANPGNFMILDEPTNDLDMDSLDMLQEYLVSYKGTLIIVSHDRDFLDNMVTDILAFEGNGKLVENLGNYSDYIKHKEGFLEKNDEKIVKKAKKIVKNDEKPEKTQKFSYKYQIELKKLPDKIEKLEEKIAKLSSELSETEDRNPANLAQISMEISQNQEKLNELEERWVELEQLKEKLQ